MNLNDGGNAPVAELGTEWHGPRSDPRRMRKAGSCNKA